MLQESALNSKCTFQRYSQYCQSLAAKLNKLDSYEAQYKISSNPLLKQHDGEFLQITNKTTLRDPEQTYIIKIHLMYSLAYSIPVFMFMIYDMQTSQPLSQQSIYSKFIVKQNYKQQQQTDKLRPQNQTGIYLTQNMITKQYFYTLHSCELNLPINLLIPFYFDLIGLHPQI